MAEERCINCDEPTGKAGRYEDSHYCSYCDDGPFCDDCYEDHVAEEEAEREVHEWPTT